MEINAAGYAALADLEMPRGYSSDESDSIRSQSDEDMSSLLTAFILSVVLIFLLMAILLESLILPFSVLFTIPFAALGALWTLLITGESIDPMGLIGLIILAGVVVNNGIVLVDRIHGLRRGEGLARSDAVIQGCAHRVRPILMTALTTVMGLLPMALSTPATDSISYKVLAIVVAGGLVVSTFFTLWVVPLAYTLLDDYWAALKVRLIWWLRRPGQPSGGALPLAGVPSQRVELP